MRPGMRFNGVRSVLHAVEDYSLKKTLSVKGLKFWVKNSIICDTQLKPSVKAADLPR